MHMIRDASNRPVAEQANRQKESYQVEATIPRLGGYEACTPQILLQRIDPRGFRPNSRDQQNHLLPTHNIEAKRPLIHPRGEVCPLRGFLSVVSLKRNPSSRITDLNT